MNPADMETFSALLALCEGNPLVTGGLPSLMASNAEIWCFLNKLLTHWGRVTHICVSKLIIIGSDNGLSPRRRQAIIWTNAGILLIRTLGKNPWNLYQNSYIFIPEMYVQISSGKWRPLRLGLNVLKSSQFSGDLTRQDSHVSSL